MSYKDMTMNALTRLSADEKSAVSKSLIKTIFNIFEAWGISNPQQQVLLGLSNEGTFYNWKKNPQSATITNDLLERASYILGIWKALQVLLPENRVADNWITAVNNSYSFNGQTPLERMLGGQVVDLAHVRQYLDAERGGW